MYLELFSLAFILVSTTDAWKKFDFEPIQMERSLQSANLLDRSIVDSIIQCAQQCCSHVHCKSFSFECAILTTGAKGDCLLMDTTTEKARELVSSSFCYVQRKGYAPSFTVTDAASVIATVPGPTTPTTTTATSSSNAAGTSNAVVLDIIYGPRDMCSTAPSSQQDFILIAKDGVYVYDEYEDVITSPCRGPLEFKSVFDDFGSLNSIDQVSCALVYQNFVEVYSESTGLMYKWQIHSGSLAKDVEQSFSTYLGLSGTSVIETNPFYWCATRHYMNEERHFYTGDDIFFFVSTQDGKKTFEKSEFVANMNGFNLNPWSNIPGNIVAGCGYSHEPSKNYILIDSNNLVYTYNLNHNLNNNDPTKTLTPGGQLSFG